jgi:DNA-binding NarL/FixJ family response regulator
MQTGGLALVIAPPGRLSDGWRALLMTTPHIAEVRQAPDATSALDVAETREPDLILVDVDALGERGWSALAQIKDERPYCRSILLVCYARQQQEARAAGADEVLIKGFQADQLSAAIERLFDRGPEGCTQ